MNTHDILSILQKDIHTVIIATVDKTGQPYTCAIDMMLLENQYLYFITARGKAFYQRLMENPQIALTGIKGDDTMSSVAISLQGKVKNIRHEKLDEIFELNSYMKTIYPDPPSRDILEVFQIAECSGEYFDLGQKPIIRESFSVNKEVRLEGYFVKEGCIGYKLCYRVCPQKCIDITKKTVVIQEDHCLHCGKCAEICPKQVIQRGIL